MKFLITGFGSIGRRHLRNLRALGEEDIILYRTHHSTLPDDEIAGLPVETSLEAALARKPDAVIIANPTALHLEVAIPAAQAGCHLLIEKPVSHSMDRLEDLKAALNLGGGRVVVGFQFRFHPGLRQMRAWLQDGEVGSAYSFRAHWGEYLPGWHPWEDYRQGYAARGDLGGGAILTLTHPLDYLRWMFGDASRLWSFAGTLGDLGIPVVDSAEIGLQFHSGTAGTIHLDFLQQPAAHTLEIFGTQGTIRWDNVSGTASLFQSKTGAWEESLVPQGFERNWLFLEELRHFIRVCKGEEASQCTLEDGIWALRLALAANHSAESGQQVKF